MEATFIRISGALCTRHDNLTGARCGLFSPVLDAPAQKKAAGAPLIENIYPLSERVGAVAHAAGREARKALPRS
jgi:hypothetical protein